MGTSSDEQQHYLVRWNNYTEKIVMAFQSLRDKEDFVDVTVACDGHSYLAHKMVLSAYSTFFHSLLRASPCQHPIVILKDVRHTDVERLLEFMYNGEVNIAQDELPAFLKTAESLKIKGLTGSSDDVDQLKNSHNCTSTSGVNKDKLSNSRKSALGRFHASNDVKIHEKSKEGFFHINTPSKSKRRKRASEDVATFHEDSSSNQTFDNLTDESINDNSGDQINMKKNYNNEGINRIKLTKSESLEWLIDSTRKPKLEPSNSICDLDDTDSSAINPNQQLEDNVAAALINLLDVSERVEPCHRCGSAMQVKRKRDRGGEFRPVLRCPRNGCQTTRSIKKVYK